MTPSGARFASLRTRMTLGFSVPFAIVTLICIGILIGWAYYVAKQDAIDRVSATAALLYRAGQQDPSEQNLKTTFEEVQRDERLGQIALGVFDEKENIVAADHSPTPPLPRIGQDRWIAEITMFGERKVIAGVYWERTRNALRDLALLLLSVGLVVIAVAAALAWVLVGRTLRPIKALSEQALAATADPLHLQLKAPSSDAELCLLVETLNGMLNRLQQDTFAKEQFYAAAAHELRTPLAVLSGSIEIALSRPHEPEEYRETLADLLNETARLITLTESLLLLNRLEMRTEKEAREEIDLADLIDRTLASAQDTIAERGLSVSVTLDEIILIAPPTHVRILVRNLLENAVRYTTTGGRITVTLTHEKTVPCFRVYNDCNLPEDTPISSLFTPFYRADVSRNTTTGGNGLGLSICEALARANTWHLFLRREVAGITAVVHFRERK